MIRIDRKTSSSGTVCRNYIHTYNHESWTFVDYRLDGRIAFSVQLPVLRLFLDSLYCSLESWNKSYEYYIFLEVTGEWILSTITLEDKNNNSLDSWKRIDKIADEHSKLVTMSLNVIQDLLFFLFTEDYYYLFEYRINGKLIQLFYFLPSFNSSFITATKLIDHFNWSPFRVNT